MSTLDKRRAEPLALADDTSSSERSRLVVTLEDGNRLVFHIGGRGVFEPPAQVTFGGLFRIVFTPFVRQFEPSQLQGFELLQPAEVVRFLELNPSLMALLLDARVQITRIFGPAKLALEVFRDPESTEGRDRLYLVIRSSLPLDEAEERLSKLDNEWWLDSMDRARGLLSITHQVA